MTDKPELAQRFKNKEYRTGQVIKTAFKSFILHLSTNNAKSTGTARVEDNNLILSLPKLENNDYYTRDFVNTLISKGISADLLPVFTERPDWF